MTFQAPNYTLVNENGFSNSDNGVEEENMFSHNHSLVQGRVSGLFNFCLEDFTAPTELSLDMTAPDRQTLLQKYEVQAVVQNCRELKPDIAIFYARDFDFIDPAEGPDAKRVTDVPLTCCEIVSPSQSSWEILNKFRVYNSGCTLLWA